MQKDGLEHTGKSLTRNQIEDDIAEITKNRINVSDKLISQIEDMIETSKRVNHQYKQKD